MTTHKLTSAKTGQTYNVRFGRDPNEKDIDDAVANFDADFYTQRDLDPALINQTPAATTGVMTWKGLGQLPMQLVDGISQLALATNDVLAKHGFINPEDPKVQMGRKFWEAGKEFSGAVMEETDRVYPTNPANKKSIALGSGLSQGIGMLAGGLAAKGIGMGAAAAAHVPLGIGFVMGAGDGIKAAKDIGVETPEETLAMGLLFGGVEMVTEKIWGLGNTKATRELLDAARKKASAALVNATKSLAGEATEEPLAGMAQDMLTNAFSQEDPDNPGFTKTGVELPRFFSAVDGEWFDADMLDRRRLETIGGLGGGVAFAGVGLAKDILAPGDATQPAPDSSPTATPAAPDTPADPLPPLLRQTFNGKNFIRANGHWMRPLSQDELANVEPTGDVIADTFAPLNTTDAVEGGVAAHLEARARAAYRTAAAPQPSPPSPLPSEVMPTENQPPTADLGAGAATTPLPQTGAIESPTAPVAVNPPLPEPGAAVGTVATNTASTEGAPVRGTAEWEWYEQLEREAAESPLKSQSAEAAARRGEVDDPKARQQADPMAEMEQEQIKKERAQARAFLAHALSSPASQRTGAQLANETAEGSLVQINDRTYIVAEVDPAAGTVALEDPDGEHGYQRIGAEDTIPIESIDGQVISDEAASTEGADTPFSLAAFPETSYPERQKVIDRLKAKVGTLIQTSYPPANRYADALLRFYAIKASTGWLNRNDWARPQPPIYRPGYATHKAAYNKAAAAVRDAVQDSAQDIINYSLDNGRSDTIRDQQGGMDAATGRVRAQAQAPLLPSDPASRIEAISASLRKSIGLRRLPDSVQIVHDTTPVTLNDGSRRQWKARVRGGRVELNTANLENAADALWNLEHELAHEAFRSPAPALKRAWERLTRALANHPDIRQEVEDFRYTPDAITEEQAVRLAQKLDTQGEWTAAWEALKKAVFNFITGKWGGVTTTFTDRIADALAARSIMADARRRVGLQLPKRGTPNQSDGEDRYSLAEEPPRGRAQPLDAPVLTPDGYRTIGSLTTGDALSSIDGQTSTVAGTYPQGRKQVFKITLADGRTVRATEDHLWLAKQHWQPSGMVRATWQIQRLLSQGHKIEIPALEWSNFMPSPSPRTFH